jgi:hypothetical protein
MVRIHHQNQESTRRKVGCGAHLGHGLGPGYTSGATLVCPALVLSVCRVRIQVSGSCYPCCQHPGRDVPELTTSLSPLPSQSCCRYPFPLKTNSFIISKPTLWFSKESVTSDSWMLIVEKVKIFFQFNDTRLLEQYFFCGFIISLLCESLWFYNKIMKIALTIISHLVCARHILSSLHRWLHCSSQQAVAQGRHLPEFTKQEAWEHRLIPS